VDQAAPERLRLTGDTKNRLAYKLGVAVVQAAVVGSGIKRRFGGAFQASSGACVPRAPMHLAPEAVVNGISKVKADTIARRASSVPVKALRTWNDVLEDMFSVSLRAPSTSRSHQLMVAPLQPPSTSRSHRLMLNGCLLLRGQPTRHQHLLLGAQSLATLCPVRRALPVGRSRHPSSADAGQLSLALVAALQMTIAPRTVIWR
jgi:hypothetical protein